LAAAKGANVGESLAELSVVLVTDRFETISVVVDRLRAQTIRAALELVIVAPSEEALGLPAADVDGFAGTTVVPVGSSVSLPASRVAGIRAAKAPLVALVETHVYPDPDWAEALVRAHREPWAAVGPVFANANPTTSLSWASLLMDYGALLEPNAGGPVGYLPSNNGCYKRELLLAQPEFEAGMAYGPHLHEALKAQGHELYVTSGARIRHLNMSVPRPWLTERYLLGRSLASLRASRWSPSRRIVYACGSPLIPLVRIWRIFRHAGRPIRQYRLLPRVLPALAVALVSSTVGELAGFTLGAGDAPKRLERCETRKIDGVREADLAGLS
jgi:hypothetical protein